MKLQPNKMRRRRTKLFRDKNAQDDSLRNPRTAEPSVRDITVRLEVTHLVFCLQHIHGDPLTVHVVPRGKLHIQSNKEH